MAKTEFIGTRLVEERAKMLQNSIKQGDTTKLRVCGKTITKHMRAVILDARKAEIKVVFSLAASRAYEALVSELIEGQCQVPPD